MAFTGDLELLNIVDIIQLLSSTRKSGTLSVKGLKGESRIIFSNGSIVGASHLNNSVRIGTVLVKMCAISRDDIEQALEIQKRSGKDRKPLIATLVEQGKLKRDDAARGLKKLIEMTLVEVIGWTEGTFTLDTEAIAVSPESSYPISKMEQEIGLDAQMVLMDALRILDERERDRQSGKSVPPDEEVFGDVVSPEESEGAMEKSAVLTADDLGLDDLDQLERKIPHHIPLDEVFDPFEIHRQKIRQILAAFPAERQEAFVSFLEKSSRNKGALDKSQRQMDRTRALILFSEEELLKHSVMILCKNEGILVFATDGEEELSRIVDQCLRMKVLPLLVFDTPKTTERLLSEEKIVSLRQQLRDRYPQLSILQVASPPDRLFTLQSLQDGVRAVFPKPSQDVSKETFIEDTITFLETFRSYVRDLFLEQKDLTAQDSKLIALKDRIVAIRGLDEPSAVSLALLESVSEVCERTVIFIVRQQELVGDKAIGVYAERSEGPTSAAVLRIPLTSPSIFREAVEKGQFFCGESDDDVLKKHLFEEIGTPLMPSIILIPMRSHGKIITLTYGDFGDKEAAPVQSEMLEIIAQSAGQVMENILYRKLLSKASQK
ncbi:MAG TPA: DUF4388 domain-containing protein [Thermodesulfovibrionales bacterium]|nr:DUF4388 domain-containing protein [Thermodesulfovibrionales bacterium]